MSEKKPAPADLAEMVAKLSGKKALLAHYNVGQKALYRWVSEAGLTLNDGRSAPRDVKHAPQDFTAMAPAMSKEQLRDHYGIGCKVLKRWIAETGAKPRIGPQVRRVLPEGFARVAPTLTFTELQAHYSVSKGVVSRWLQETGTSPLRTIAAPAKQAGKGNIRPSRGNGRSNLVQFRAPSDHDFAADELRRFCPVSRCDERGVYAQGGNFWRVGNVICTPDELLARAERVRRKAA